MKAAVSGIVDKAKNAASNVAKAYDEHIAGEGASYISKSVDQVIRGKYTENVTVAGTVGQIITGIAGVDIAGDVRDLVHDFTNWEWSGEHVGDTIIDTVALIPGIGAIKNIAKGVEVVDGIVDGAKAAKKIEKAVDAAKDAEKAADTIKRVEDTGKGAKKVVVQTEDVISDVPLSRRPTWRETEIDAHKEFPDYKEQISFLDGKEVPYGSPKSVRPDLYCGTQKQTIEMKNYNLSSAKNRSNLVRNIENQYNRRKVNLPKGTKQTIIIDTRGQNISEEIRGGLYNDIMKRTDDNVEILFKTK